MLTPYIHPHNTDLLFPRDNAPSAANNNDLLLCVPMLGGDRTGDNRQK